MAENITRIYELQVKLANESLTQLKKIESHAKGIEDSFHKAGEKVKEFGRELLSMVTAAVGVEAIIHAVEQTIEKFDQLGNAAERAGMGVETFTQLAYAAKQADAELGDLEHALKELQKTMVETDTKGAKVLDALGVDKTKEPLEVLLDFADALKSIQDPALKVNAILEVLGRNGLMLRPMLEKGSEGIRQLMGEGTKLGATMDELSNEKIESLDKQMKRVGSTMDGLKKNTVLGLTDSLNDAGKAFEDAAKAGKAFEVIGGALGVVVRGLAAYVATLVAGIELFIIANGAAIEQSRKLLTGDFAGAAAVPRQMFADMREMADATIERLKLLLGLKHEAEGEERTPPIDRPSRDKGVRDALAGAKDAAKEARGPWDALNASLESQLQTLKDSGVELDAYTLALRKITAVMKDLTPEQFAQAQALLAQIDAWDKANKITKEQTEGMRRVDDILKGLRTPLEQAMDDIAEMYVLMGKFPERSEQLMGAVEARWARYVDSLKEAKDKTKETADLFDKLADKVDGYAKQMSDALIDFATSAGTAKLSFSDMTLSLLKDVTKMITQMLVFEPLIENLKTSIKGMKADGFSWANLLAKITGSAVSGGSYTNPNASARGNVFDSPDLSRYSGGIYNSPRMFAFAHGTGVFAEAGPEAVMPLTRGPDGRLGVDTSGGGNVTVNVINQAGAEVGVESKRSATGEREITVLIQRAVADGFSRGRFDAVMGATYGVARRGH